MTIRIKLRRDSATAWSQVNPILASGEVGIDLTNRKIKIGDGTTVWNTLPYWDAFAANLDGYATETYVDEAIGAITVPDLTGYATETYVDEAIGAITVPDLTGYVTTATLAEYATETYVDEAIGAITVPDLTGYVTTATLANYATTASLAEYATETYVDTAVSNVTVDLTGYATETYVTNALSSKADLTALIGLATETYVDTAVGTIEIPVDISDLTDTEGLLGGAAGPVQPYLELTNTPFIIQPVALGTPVTVSTPGDGSGALLEIVIGDGPVITSITVTTPGTGYIVGQRYRVWSYQIGGSNTDIDSIDFEVATIGASGELLTVTDAAFVGTATNTTGTYSQLGIELRASPGDAIGPGLTLVRGRIGALFNIEAETEYNQDTYASPLGTAWNNDGWDNLIGIGSRDYVTLRAALNNQVGNNIVGAELVMRDTINDKYYKFIFSDWGGDNGGSYAYTRTEITDPNYFRKPHNAEVFDIIKADSPVGTGIALVRTTSAGIHNWFQEEEYTDTVSPLGTTWNADGWTDLRDLTTRTYTSFAIASDYSNVLGKQFVMYVASLQKYYAVEFYEWATNGDNNFAYIRYEIDQTKINEGIAFPDGSILKSAAGVGRVKLTAPGNRRIEEVSGYKQVAVTSRFTNNTVTTTTANNNISDTWQVNIDAIGEVREGLISLYNSGAYYEIEVSVDENNWTKSRIGGWGESSIQIVFNNGATLSFDQGDTIYYRIITGSDPVVWWDKADLPGGAADFRGAVIDYHAYTGESTIIGTIHIVDDDGEEHISHQEVQSGSTDGDNDDLWLVPQEGQIQYRRIDGESKTLKIQWTAKVFYGSELYD